MNTSTKLDWNIEIYIFITEYMIRMKEADYDEKYRKTSLDQGFKEI